MGVCGLCTVLVNGKMVASCLNLAALVDGQEVTTIEGIAEDGRLHPVQQAFIDYGGFQCGICTPGQIMAAKALLDENPEPSEEEVREWMTGNLCRCTGYYKIPGVGGERAGEPQVVCTTSICTGRLPCRRPKASWTSMGRRPASSQEGPAWCSL